MEIAQNYAQVYPYLLSRTYTYIHTCIHLLPHARADTIQVLEHEHNFSKFDQLRPVGSGAAWRRSPHQKSAGRDREKGEKGGKKAKRGERKEREEKGKKGRGEQEVKMY